MNTSSTARPSVLIRLALVAGLACTAIAAAQTGGPLAGPSVEADDLNPSLIEKNIDGTMRPVDVPLAEAALELVEIDEPTRAAIDELLTKRAAAIDAIVKDNLETLDAIRASRQAGERDKRREHGRTIQRLFAPVLEDGLLEHQIAALLPEGEREVYLGLIADHHQARIAERMAKRMEEGGRGMMGEPGMFGGPGMGEEPLLFGEGGTEKSAEPGERGPRMERRFERMSQMQTLQMEIRRSVDRVVGERRGRMDELIEALDLTSEQEAEVRKLFEKRRADEQAGQGGRRERARMFRELASILTPEQQATFRELYGRPGRDRARPGRQPADD